MELVKVVKLFKLKCCSKYSTFSWSHTLVNLREKNRGMLDTGNNKVRLFRWVYALARENGSFPELDDALPRRLTAKSSEMGERLWTGKNKWNTEECNNLPFPFVLTQYSCYLSQGLKSWPVWSQAQTFKCKYKRTSLLSVVIIRPLQSGHLKTVFVELRRRLFKNLFKINCQCRLKEKVNNASLNEPVYWKSNELLIQKIDYLQQLATDKLFWNYRYKMPLKYLLNFYLGRFLLQRDVTKTGILTGLKVYVRNQEGHNLNLGATTPKTFISTGARKW